MTPQRRNSRKVLLIAAFLALAAALLYGALFVQVKKKNERISTLLNTIAESAEQERVLASTKTLIAETAPLREKLALYRIARNEVVSFIEMLESLGRAAGAVVTIESVEVVPQSASEAAERVRIAVRFEGGWPEVVRFLGLLELLPVESRIEQARISRKNAGDEKRVSLWRGDATLFVLKEK